MGDYGNFNLTAWSSDGDTLEAIRDFCVNGDYSGTYIYADDMEPGISFNFGANDVSLGSVGQAADGLLDLIKDGVEDYTCPVCKGKGRRPGSEDECLRCKGEGYYHLPIRDFAFIVHDEPKYEWMGSIFIHVPGLPDFEGECDADGVVQVNAKQLITLLDEASDLDALRAEAAALTGHRHSQAIEKGSW